MTRTKRPNATVLGTEAGPLPPLLWARAVLMLVGLTLLGLTLAVQAQQVSVPDQIEARVRALSADLRCIVCQDQSFGDAHSDLAGELRRELRHEIERGRTDSQVVAHLVARYGDFVRYRPAMGEGELLLWLAASLVPLAGLVWLIRLLLRRPLVSN